MKKVVNAIIFNENKFLIMKRSSSKENIHSGKWAFPGGIVEENETAEQALKRELKEETNLELKKIIKKISSYNYKRQNNEDTYGECYLVDADGKVLISEEADDFRWVTIEELGDLDFVDGMDEEILIAMNNLK